MRIELAILAALGTMACSAQADGQSPTVEDVANLTSETVLAPTASDIASKPTAEVEVVPLTELPVDPFHGDPCPPCGRG